VRGLAVLDLQRLHERVVFITSNFPRGLHLLYFTRLRHLLDGRSRLPR
jgi:hypothetical protein